MVQQDGNLEANCRIHSCLAQNKIKKIRDTFFLNKRNTKLLDLFSSYNKAKIDIVQVHPFLSPVHIHKG